MNESLTISLSVSSTTGAGGGMWVSVEQEEYDEPIATQGELASFVDALYNIDPCKTEQVADPNANDGFYVDESKPDVWGAPPEEDFNFLVKEQLPPEMCDFTEDSGYTATLNVFMSDISKPFKLVLDVGIVGYDRRVKEPFEDRIVIENSTSYTLKYPVADDFEHNWISLVILGGGVVNVKVDEEDKRTLSFGTAVTGTLDVSYETEYYKVDVFIPGENEEPQFSNATVFYVGLVAETDIEPPDVDEGDAVSKDAWCVPNPLDEYDHEIVKVPFPDHDVTCQVEVSVRHLCDCSKTLSYTSRYLEGTSCPDRTRCYDYQTECTKIIGYRTEIKYVDCGETTEDINDPEFYEASCCEEVPKGMELPLCKKEYSIKNTVPLDEEIANEYIRTYGEEVVSFVGVGPKDGYCGENIIEQVLTARDCCEDPPPLYFTKSVDQVQPGESYVFCADGGVFPYNWSASGSGLSISGRNICATLSVDDGFCDGGEVQLLDSCNHQITQEIAAGIGYWEEITEADWPSGLIVDAIGDMGPVTGGSSTVQGSNGKYRAIQRFDPIEKNTAAEACAYSVNRYTKFVKPKGLDGYGNPVSDCSDSPNSISFSDHYDWWIGWVPLESPLYLYEWKCDFTRIATPNTAVERCPKCDSKKWYKKTDFSTRESIMECNQCRHSKYLGVIKKRRG